LAARAALQRLVYSGPTVFAFLEAGLWEGLVRREQAAVFGWLQHLPVGTAPSLPMWLLPLLALL
jgi:hypothetical protein